MAAAVYLNDDDVLALKELNSICKDVSFQMVPSDTPKSVDEILKAYENKERGE